MLSLVAAAMLAAVAPDAPPAPAAASPPAAQPAAAPAETGGKKSSRSDRVCWDQTPVGTRFSKRVCATRGDLDDRRQRDQDLIRTVRTAPTPSD